MKTCSYCGRQGEDHAFYCGECGTPLPGEIDPAQTETPNNPIRAAHDQQMIHGAIWCIAGILVTAMTYSAAANSPSGGTYVIAYGAVFYGIVKFFRGLLRISPSVKRKIVGYQDTAYNATLNPAARTPEMLDSTDINSETTAQNKDVHQSNVGP